MKLPRILLLPAGLALALALPVQAADSPAPKAPSHLPDLPVEQAILTAPPRVPPPFTRKTSAHVVVNLEVREVVGRLADGVEYTFWTYGGTVPGSFIRIREGDVVEFNLANHATSKLPHNIDLHAVTGPGGGATPTITAPGDSSHFLFRALNPGLYVYHCATTPVPMHVANGLYGLILVEPKDGLPPVDREYYVMQGEFYTSGAFGDTGLQAFDLAKANDERPTYVVFNGAVGSLLGDKALTAKVGETVRLYFGDGGPNLISSFHLIGESFDRVWTEGGMKQVQEHVQTTMVPPGGSTIVEFKVEVPGTYVLVDHSLTRAFNKGALGMLKVTGPEDRVTYSGQEIDSVYLGAQSDAGMESALREAELQSLFTIAVKSNPKIAGLKQDIQSERGRQVYLGLCFACHLPDGKGLPGVFPPLAGSDFLLADHDRPIRIVLKGLLGPVTVNGVTFNSAMPPLAGTLSEQQIADVLTYVTNEWGNKAAPYAVEDVRRVKNEDR